MVMSFQLNIPSSLPPRKEALYPPERKLGGSEGTGLDVVPKREILPYQD
jgi:hypothetical protein